MVTIYTTITIVTIVVSDNFNLNFFLRIIFALGLIFYQANFLFSIINNNKIKKNLIVTI